jgi:hypothetical protein
MIAGREACSEHAEFPLITSSIAYSDPVWTAYVLELPARCLQCGAGIKEKTLVEWDGQD